MVICLITFRGDSLACCGTSADRKRCGLVVKVVNIMCVGASSERIIERSRWGPGQRGPYTRQRGTGGRKEEFQPASG